MSAGPRDVIDVQVVASRHRLQQASPERAAALTEEGQLLVLELMGRLVTSYQNHSSGVRA